MINTLKKILFCILILQLNLRSSFTAVNKEKLTKYESQRLQEKVTFKLKFLFFTKGWATYQKEKADDNCHLWVDLASKENADDLTNKLISGLADNSQLKQCKKIIVLSGNNVNEVKAPLNALGFSQTKGQAYYKYGWFKEEYAKK